MPVLVVCPLLLRISGMDCRCCPSPVSVPCLWWGSCTPWHDLLLRNACWPSVISASGFKCLCSDLFQRFSKNWSKVKRQLQQSLELSDAKYPVTQRIWGGPAPTVDPFMCPQLFSPVLNWTSGSLSFLNLLTWVCGEIFNWLKCDPSNKRLGLIGVVQCLTWSVQTLL